MAKIMHFVADGENGAVRFQGQTHQVSEYIVITDDDDADPEESERTGFHFDHAYELDDTGRLPTERELFADC